jgi:hypothetical protein
MFTFYILFSAIIDKYYIGHTGDDIERMLAADAVKFISVLETPTERVKKRFEKTGMDGTAIGDIPCSYSLTGLTSTPFKFLK